MVRCSRLAQVRAARTQDQGDNKNGADCSGGRAVHIANFSAHIDVALASGRSCALRHIIDRFRERGGQPMIEQRLKDVLTGLLGREDFSIVVKLDIPRRYPRVSSRSSSASGRSCALRPLVRPFRTKDIIDRFRERGGQPMIEQRLKDQRILTGLLGREDFSIVVKLDI